MYLQLEKVFKIIITLGHEFKLSTVHPMSTFQNSFGSEFYPQNSNHESCFGITVPQKEFKRSQNHAPNFGLGTNKQKINLKQFQFQQKILMLKIQNKIQSIFDTLQPKIQNIKQNAFKNLKQTQNPQQILQMQRNLCTQSIQNIFIRITDFTKRQRVKLLSKSFANIVLRSIWVSRVESSQKGKKKPSDKRDSQMLRVNSKLDENSMHLSELMMDGEGSNYSSSLHPKQKNKQLKKQKQKIQRKHSLLLEQFDQLLTTHQQSLKKK